MYYLHTKYKYYFLHKLDSGPGTGGIQSYVCACADVLLYFVNCPVSEICLQNAGQH